MEKNTNSTNSQQMKELQDGMISYRNQVPQIYNQLLKKELAVLKKNLREMEYTTDSQSVNYKDAKKSYINNNLSQNIKPNDKLTHLNAKADTLIKCIEYVKK